MESRKQMQIQEKKEFFYPKTRATWRAWLVKNHEKKSKIYVIKYKKHTGKHTVTSKEAMEEAICFGWIDTTTNRIDDEKYSQCFVKRTSKGRWSNNTLSYAKKLMKEGKMTPAGLLRYKEGLKKPVNDHGLPKNPPVPEDLKKELQKNNALDLFMSFAPSYKRTYIVWVSRAKRPETRMKRIQSIIKRSLEKRRPDTLKM